VKAYMSDQELYERNRRRERSVARLVSGVLGFMGVMALSQGSVPTDIVGAVLMIIAVTLFFGEGI
jgi:hypothetical protein